MSSLAVKGLYCGIHNNVSSLTLSSPPAPVCKTNHLIHNSPPLQQRVYLATRVKRWKKLKPLSAAFSAPPPLDLTEDNVRQVLVDARAELGQIFDTSVGMTGTVELAELDGPFVKISLKGRFWHKRSTVVARVANYLKQRIPEILEVEIEDEKQLDDSPASF